MNAARRRLSDHPPTGTAGRNFILMSVIPTISFIVHLAINGWLLLILGRRGTWRQLPWFVCYVISEFAGACVGLALWHLNRQLYVSLYWWMDAAQVFLIVGTVRESFLKTFIGFSSLRWFSWLVSGVIASVLAYASWKAIYAPPVQNNRTVSLIVNGEFAFRWGIVAVGLLSMLLVWLFALEAHTRETAVINGSAIASGGFLAWSVVRSLFGTKYALIMQYVPELAYLMAAWIWIKYMSVDETQYGFSDIGMTPEQLEVELGRYRQAAERLIGVSRQK